MKVAIDVMGGDFAPKEIVRGAFLTAEKRPDLTLILVGNKNEVADEIAIGGGKSLPNLEITHTTQVIEMEESPVEAIRQKRDASLLKCINLVAAKQADAFVSAGNTGAVVAGATLRWGFLEGVKRSGIAIPFPTRKGFCYIIDVGANIYCNPIHLLQYGIMASVYYQSMKKVSQPRVGLLNIGEEDSKGNHLVRESLKLFKKSGLNFVGNIEGQNVFKGDCDVIVCEGFVGNVILKSSEGCAEFIIQGLLTELKNNKDRFQDAERFHEIAGRLSHKIDYAEYGGAPLLGVNGVAIICHGRSLARAMAKAIEVAAQFAREKINEEIVKTIRQTPLSWFDILKSWKTHH